MKRGRCLFLAAWAASLPLFMAGHVSAAPGASPMAPGSTSSITRELRVRALVPGHRDIILDLSGRISKIISNTPEDLTPDVYLLDTIDENQQPLTDSLLQEYRKLVPVGTAKYGVLYDRQTQPRAQFITSVVASPSNPLSLSLAPASPDTSVRRLLMAVK